MQSRSGDGMVVDAVCLNWSPRLRLPGSPLGPVICRMQMRSEPCCTASSEASRNKSRFRGFRDTSETFSKAAYGPRGDF